MCRLHVELEGERLPDSTGAAISGHEQPIHQGKKSVFKPITTLDSTNTLFQEARNIFVSYEIIKIDYFVLFFRYVNVDFTGPPKKLYMLTGFLKS